MKKQILIIGGGIAGIECAIGLSSMGYKPTIVEKGSSIGGKLNNWDRLFPDQTPANEVLDRLINKLANTSTEIIYNTEVIHIDKDGNCAKLSNGNNISYDVLVIASGYDIFDATIKEEYGYGLYKNVYTSVDLERMFKDGNVLTNNGEAPKTVAILHCVGSRDEKVCQNHCSRLCCVTGIKQAIEIKQLYPDCDVYNFYMDMRMFGPGYEELYRTSQQTYGVNHIRGRISEAGETIDGKIQVKAEDTLVSRPLKMSVDMLILLVGMCAGKSNADFADQCGFNLRPSGFMKPLNPYDKSNYTEVDNIFLVGSVKAPKNVSETLNDAMSAAHCIDEYLKRK